MRAECDNEMLHRQRLRDDAQGWFSMDQEKLEAAERYDMPNCRRLKSFGRL